MDNVKQAKTIDMLNAPLLPGLVMFALPIALSGILQQLFNFADTAVLGRFSDASALAAVGTNGEIVALIVSLSAGLSMGANVRIAAEIGKGRKDSIPNLIHTAWTLAIFSGIIIMIFGILLAVPVLSWIHTPESAFSQAVLYLRIYAIGCPALMIYDFGSAILRAHGDSRRPLLAMMLSGFLNLLLNLFFVVVLRWGVFGVALATDLSTLLSASLVVKWVRELNISGTRRFQKEEVMGMLRIGIPAALQGAVFCFANIFVQSAVNSFGTTVVAGATAAMNFEYLTYYAITAFGQTATTFTGQNYSAGNMERCKKIGRYCVLLSAVCCGALTIPLCIFRYEAARLFSTDAGVIEAAALRMITILSIEPLCACYESLSGVLRGMGESFLPALETILGTCLLRIIWTQSVFLFFGTQRSLYIAFPISWIITSLAVYLTYRWKWKTVSKTQ